MEAITQISAELDTTTISHAARNLGCSCEHDLHDEAGNYIRLHPSEVASDHRSMQLAAICMFTSALTLAAIALAISFLVL